MSAAVKLYELVEARDILDQFIAEAEGEETPEIAALWEQLDGDLNTKAQNVGLWLREKQSEIAALKAEESWLRQKREARENALERSKKYFVELLQKLGRTELGTATARLCRQNNAPSLETKDEDWPADRLIAMREIFPSLVRVTYELDKREALAHLKGGGVIDRCAMVVKQHLRVR